MWFLKTKFATGDPGMSVASQDKKNMILESACPFLDAHDSRCSSRFTLNKLDDMLDMCVGGSTTRCVMFHRLRMEQEQGILVATSPPALPDPVLMTCNGTPIGLRPTGS